MYIQTEKENINVRSVSSVFAGLPIESDLSSCQDCSFLGAPQELGGRYFIISKAHNVIT